MSMQTETQELLRELSEQRKLLEAKLAAISKKIEAVTTTAELLAERREGSDDSRDRTPVDLEIPQGIKGMTQHAALVALAKANGGKVKIVDAVQVLRRHGILKAKKHAWNVIFSVMQRKGGWIKSAPGEYRYVGDGASQKKSVHEFKVEVGDNINALRDAS